MGWGREKEEWGVWRRYVEGSFVRELCRGAQWVSNNELRDEIRETGNTSFHEREEDICSTKIS